jgi:hypothetical protein
MGASTDGAERSEIDPMSWPKEARDYWEKIEKAPDPPVRGGLSADEYRVDVDVWKVQIEIWKLGIQTRLEGPKLTIEFSKLAIAQILTINAGAIVAILALVGSLAARSPNPVLGAMPKLAIGLTFFAMGTTLAILVAAFSYMSQLAGGMLQVAKSMRYQKVAKYLFGCSLVVFLAGTVAVAKAFFEMPQP